MFITFFRVGHQSTESEAPFHKISKKCLHPQRHLLDGNRSRWRHLVFRLFYLVQVLIVTQEKFERLILLIFSAVVKNQRKRNREICFLVYVFFLENANIILRLLLF